MGCYPQRSDFAYVSVDRVLHTFKPRGGAQLVQQSGTMLSLYMYSASGTSASGCWIIADSDFTVVKDLSSASLSTTVPAESNCPRDTARCFVDERRHGQGRWPAWTPITSVRSQGQITRASASLTSDYASIDQGLSHQIVKGAPVDACFF